jgi:excisionase family DNA binding protein
MSFLTYDQVSAMLHVPTGTVRYWVSAGKLNAYKPGRHPLIKAAELEAFVEAGSLKENRASAAKTRAGVARKRAARVSA